MIYYIIKAVKDLKIVCFVIYDHSNNIVIDTPNFFFTVTLTKNIFIFTE